MKKNTEKNTQEIAEKNTDNNQVDLYQAAQKLHLASNFIAAEKNFLELLAFDPNHALALADLGTLYLQTNRLADGETYLKKSLALDPNQAFVLNNLGTICSNANKPEEAKAYYLKATEINPNYADAFNNLGLSYYGLHQFNEALNHFLRATEINPNYIDAHYHLALCFVATHQFKQAEQHFNIALKLRPNFSELKLNLGLMKLLLGDFEAGLHLYESRWAGDGSKKNARQFEQPLWLGADNIAGKTILLHPEQGFGDFVQFCRYALDLEKLGAKVILEVQAPLLPLIKTLSSKFTYVLHGQKLPTFDFHCPIASLPLVLNTRLETIPSYHSYLKKPADRKQFWQKKLGKKTLPRVGIVWSGSTNYKNDWKRGLPVHLLTTILRLDAEFHSLQKKTKPRDWQILAINQVKNKLISHENDLHDFGDTAALADEMDLIISVDTSVAHVVGALGKPTWLLIPYLPDFRWLLARDDSPWYPTVKLFRQTIQSDWKELIARVHVELTNWLKKPTIKPVQFSKQAEMETQAAPKVLPELGDKAQLDKAIALHHAKKTDKAEALYKKHLAKHPNDTGANNMLGTLYLQVGKHAEAEVFLKHALLLAPKNSFALCNLAVIYSETNRKKEAIRLCEQALEIKPDFVEVNNNLGSYLCHIEDNQRAAIYLKRATELKPDYTDAHFNLGLVYYRLKKFDLAEAEFNTVIAQQPTHLGAFYNLGLLKLLLGDFETGLPLYEQRWQDKQAKLQIRNFEQPMWLGKESLQGRTILLHSEQGHGDLIQFCRFAFAVEKLGAKVILEVHALQFELAKTLSDNFNYILKDQTLPKFDYHCPLLSLPLALNMRLDSIPAKVPYLKVPNNKLAHWKDKLGKKTLPRVGIVWSGTTGHLNDHNRSISLNQLGTLFSANAEFHVLQKEIRASDDGALKLLQAFNNLHVYQHDLHDFVDTAALIYEMDLVISVDTSVAHLAGALAVPIWIMLSFIPDFRWLLDREDSPWYPTAQLFRQAEAGNWSDVIERVKLALNQYLLILPTSKNSLVTDKPKHDDLNIRSQINEAIGLHAAGNNNAALHLFLSIHQAAPNNAEVLTILATIYMLQNQLAPAQSYFEKSLSLDRKNALTLHNYGLLLGNLNRVKEAITFINNALDTNPLYEDAYKNKVILLKKLDDNEAIISTLLTATSHFKQSAHFYFQLHQYLYKAERFDEALTAINQFIALDANAVEAYNNRGNTLQALKKPNEALLSYQQALSIQPTHIHAISNSGNAYLILNDPEKALKSCEAALAIDPTFIAALNNRASALGQLKRFDEAIHAYDTIIEMNASNHFANFNKGLLCLLTGDFKTGWPLYESRWHAITNKTIMKEFLSKPLWLGKTPAKGKTILIHSEQGYGDLIQLSRYLPLLVKLGFKQILFAVTIGLYQLFVDSFKQPADFRAVMVVTDNHQVPQFDCQCPVMSLPLAFDTQLETIPAKIPYLFADNKLAAKWKSTIQNHPNKKAKVKKVNIGLVWAGSAVHINNINRSLTLDMLADILAINVQFHCLQKEVDADEAANFKELHIQAHDESLHDFAETAALISHMDLVISVDTSVAHLAGAMGKTVWILLPYIPDYRWLLDRNDSPWYPTAQLFRQTKAGNWTDVIVRVKQALEAKFKLT